MEDSHVDEANAVKKPQQASEGKNLPSPSTDSVSGDPEEAKEHEHLPQFEVSAPAEIHQQADLAPVITRHQRWIQQVLDPQIICPSGRANFSGQDLRGYDFSGKDLRCADFTDAKLDHANFAEANLARCNLSGASVLKTIFRKTCLRKARLEGVNIQTAHLQETDLSQTTTEPEHA